MKSKKSKETGISPEFKVIYLHNSLELYYEYEVKCSYMTLQEHIKVQDFATDLRPNIPDSYYRKRMLITTGMDFYSPDDICINTQTKETQASISKT